MEDLVSISMDQIEFLRKCLPSQNVSGRIADFFSVFGDNTRVRILSALVASSMCVGDLCYLLKINQTTASHQLKLLRDAKIVEAKRVGRLIVYSVCNKFVADVIVLGVDKIQKDNENYNYETNIG